ncbi:DUF2332 domain-containing protein [Candidatus Binatia bacterium]|nr:DUF2332 domain-containing protein [Candidatus Binatia bacterium]
MKPDPIAEQRPVLDALSRSMFDPALSGGCPLLGEMLGALGDDPVAVQLMLATPLWKIPGLMLSAALLYRACADPAHPLARYLPGRDAPLDAGFRGALHEALVRDRVTLAALMERHTYQCNPPRRLAVSAVAIAEATRDWPRRSVVHVDVGTASGLGLLLGHVAARVGGARIGPEQALLELEIELHGGQVDPRALVMPEIERAVGIDLDPPDLRDPACRAWMRACQYTVAEEWAIFDRAIDLVLERRPRIERGSATDLLPRIVAEMPPGQPLLVTDTYVAVFMSEDEREHLRRELDAIAAERLVVWLSQDPPVPLGRHPERTTAGVPIPAALVERIHREMFGLVCVTTWPGGVRTPRLVGVTHPGGCWLEWHE